MKSNLFPAGSFHAEELGEGKQLDENGMEIQFYSTAI